MDTISKEDRRRVMQRIKSKNTSPEMMVRKYLYQRGLRYRANDKRLPGSPDIVLKRYKTAIFVHGCFWHGHEGCKLFRIPKSNVDYWVAKVNNNRVRDEEVFEELKALGWNVVIVWECQLKGKEREHTLERVYYETIYENGPNNFEMERVKKKRNNHQEPSETI